MKEIKLKIDDDVYGELTRGMNVRIMIGSAHGIQDAFMAKLIESIDKGDDEVEIKYKDKK